MFEKPTESYQDILNKVGELIKGASKSSEYCNFLLSLQKAVTKKIEYQKELQELAKETKIPVNKLLQELFVTHFEALSAATHALDAEGKEFLAAAKELITFD